MFLSVSARLLVNVEALNMVESVGNVVRHRRAPIIVPSQDKNEYVLVYTPVISGESLANAYQRWLAQLAKQGNLPVCSNCEKAFFVKHGDPEVFGELTWEQKLRENMEKLDFHEIEAEIVKNCLVEDVGGFLLPEARPVKRTSKFQVGFMVPAYDQIRKSALEAQFHVRYAPDPARHSIYYVELGSALYIFHFNIDLGNIGYTTMIKRENVVGENERQNRIKVAIEALAHMLENKLFGAHLSRHNPVTELRSLVALLSEPLPFTASLAHEPCYLEETRKRGRDFSRMVEGEKIRGWYMDREGLKVEELGEKQISLNKAETVSEVFQNIIRAYSEK
jgi:CRISPR-associated protein Csa2